MKILFLFLISFSASAMWIRVAPDGTIMDSSVIKSKPSLDVEIVTSKIQNTEGAYIFKYINGSLIPLTPEEIELHPYRVDAAKVQQLINAKENALTRLKGCRPIDFTDQFMKDLCLQYREIR